MPDLTDPAARREYLKPKGVKEKAKFAANYVRRARGGCESCAAGKPDHSHDR